MRPSAVPYIYWLRLRRHWGAELFAALGVAVGVALVFGVLLASSSLTTSAGELVTSVVGKARFALVSRSDAGMSEALVEAAGNLPGVRVSSPVLIEAATILGPRGRRFLQLIGATPSLATLGGSTDHAFSSARVLLGGGVGLPAQLAREIGARPGARVDLLATGAARSAALRALFGQREIGGAASVRFAAAALPEAQRLAGRQGVVSEILIEPQPGAEREVHEELLRLAAGRLDVEPANYESTQLEEAIAPNRQATDVFALVGALVGLLLAANAMLLTASERRRWVASLRMTGFTPRQLVAVILFQALAVGSVASILGLVVGDLLAHTLLSPNTDYLTFAFPIGTQQSISATAIVLALLAGIAAALLAASPPLLDLFADRPPDAPLRKTRASRRHLNRRAIAGAFALALALGALGGVLALLVPASAVIDIALLAGSCLLCVAPALLLFVAALIPLAERHGSSLVVSVVAIRAGALRALSVAAIVALSLYGSVTIQGAREDLIRGIDAAIAQFGGTAKIWVTGGENVFGTEGIGHDEAYRTLTHLPKIAAARRLFAALLDVGDRRVWVRAREASAPAQIEPSQLIAGNARRAQTLLRGEGWVALSQSLADEAHAHLGGPVTLPTPAGQATLRVAAITTNSGWPPGAITLSARDFERYWQSKEPGALEVEPKPGAPTGAAMGELRSAFGNDPGLSISSQRARLVLARRIANQGLQSLEEISTLLLLAAALATALAISASIWQRRPELATLKTYGFSHRRVWRALLCETALILLVGALDGALLGTAGHAIDSNFLRASTGFPAPFMLEGSVIALAVGLIVGVSLLVVAVPGYIAALVDQRLAYR
jgi:putative ABC transport system permease protein